jgi:radical SAM protein with 4Fe4S-binding SPASM domain
MIRAVVLGTSGVCNSSCLICPRAWGIPPDGKPMSWSLYTKIVDGISKVGAERVGFGLFDEPLLDPLLVDRLAYLKERVKTHVILSTNGSLLSPAVVRVLNRYVDAFLVAFHAITPDVYKKIMPLHRETVLRNLEYLVSEVPKEKIHIAVVRTVLNWDEPDFIAKRFNVKVDTFRVSNRCGSLPSFDILTRGMPLEEGCCNEETTRDLIVDWDGKVLLCCQDFKREYPIGDLTVQTVEETLKDPRRIQTTQLLSKGRHKDIPTCRKCRWTVRTGEY